MVSAIVEMIVCAALLLRGSIHFLVTRAHQLKPLEQANEGTQLYFSGILILEYLLRPFSMFLLYCAGEGFIRWLAAWSTEEVLPSLPLNLASLIQEWFRKRRRERELSPVLPDVLEPLQGGEYALRILSCRAKEGWRESVTIAIHGELYELAKLNAGTPTHPFEYLLRKQPPGCIIRGMYRYEPC